MRSPLPRASAVAERTRTKSGAPRTATARDRGIFMAESTPSNPIGGIPRILAQILGPAQPPPGLRTWGLECLETDLPLVSFRSNRPLLGPLGAPSDGPRASSSALAKGQSEGPPGAGGLEAGPPLPLVAPFLPSIDTGPCPERLSRSEPLRAREGTVRGAAAGSRPDLALFSFRPSCRRPRPVRAPIPIRAPSGCLGVSLSALTKRHPEGPEQKSSSRFERANRCGRR
jgi:hypothetical protein